jgi:hypothetical protein
MLDYTLNKAEILALALATTDAGAILGGSTDWSQPRKFDCPNCGEIGTEGVRQASAMKFVCMSAAGVMRSRMSGYRFEVMKPN